MRPIEKQGVKCADDPDVLKQGIFSDVQIGIITDARPDITAEMTT